LLLTLFYCVLYFRPEDLHRIRVEHMERQLANLTGLVQKALVNQNPQIAPISVPTLDSNYLVVPSQIQGMSISFKCIFFIKHYAINSGFQLIWPTSLTNDTFLKNVSFNGKQKLNLNADVLNIFGNAAKYIYLISLLILQK